MTEKDIDKIVHLAKVEFCRNCRNCECGISRDTCTSLCTCKEYDNFSEAFRKQIEEIKYAKIIIDKEILREVIDTLYDARLRLLKMTALDSPQEMARKETENDCAIARKILSTINLIKEDVNMMEE